MKRDFKQEALELRTKRAKLVEEMNDLTEPTRWNTEAQKRYKQLDAEQRSMKEQIDALESQATLAGELRLVAAPPAGAIITDPANGSQRTLTPVDNSLETREFFNDDQKKYFEMRNSQEYRKAFWRHMRSKGSKAESILDECLSLEARAYAGLGDTSSSTDGYYLVPIGFQREIERKLISFGGMRRNSRVLNTSTGNVMNWPTGDDTANVGNWVAEAGSVAQVNPTFSNVQFNAWLASSKQVLVSVQLLQDSAFDLEAWLSEQFAIRLARITNLGYTSGNGTTQPNGILTAIEADGGSELLVTAVGSSSNDGGGSVDGSNSIGSDDLANLIAELDPMYRVNAKFMAHWSVFDYLRKLKDKYGRPLWEVSIAQGVPDKIYGYPYDWNADMQQWTQGASESGAMASKYTMLFGDFSKYVVREVGGITMVRFNELYMPNHQVGFQAFLRTDGQRIQQAAFALLQQAAS